MNEKKKKLMREAIRLAVDNVRKKGGPFGALVVKEGKIIAAAVNEVLSTNDPTAHAEVQAIREACRKLDTIELPGCEIYCSCEPCPMCLGAIYWTGIEKIYYAGSRKDAEKAGFRDNLIYDEMIIEPSKRSISAEQLLADEGREAFGAWMAWEDRPFY